MIKNYYCKAYQSQSMTGHPLYFFSLTNLLSGKFIVMGMPTIVHFEIPSDNIERSKNSTVTYSAGILKKCRQKSCQKESNIGR